MNQRNLVILIASLALVALAVILTSPGDQSSLGEGDLLLPGLAENLNDVTQLSVRRSGSEQVAVLTRTENGWVVSDRDNYPANFTRLRQNLRGLAEARLFETKTANPEFYDRLGVQDISEPLATGTEFTLGGTDLKAQIIVGRTDEGGGNLAYVRRSGEAQSYLVKASLDPGKSANDWLDANILDIPSSRVRSVEIRHPDGEILAIAKGRSESVNYTVADIPPGRSLTYEGAANAIGAALAGLSLDDVQSANTFDPGDIEATVATFETFDGLRLTVHTWAPPEGQRRVAFSAEATIAKPANDDAASDEIGESGPVDAEAVAGIIDEAADITARLGGWVYTLPSFKSEQFVQRMNGLLAAPE
ncbi:MAG: DUF4340 domain-containing protein [Gammaproteobacteria bacterium]